MKKLLIFATMITRQIFSLLKNVLIFLFNRLYKEWKFVMGNDRSYSEKASERGDLYTKQIIENIIHERASKYIPYTLDGNETISLGPLAIVMEKARVTGLSSLHRTNVCSLMEEGNRLFINSHLGVGPLTYRRPIVLRFGDFERKAIVLVSVINMDVSVDFSVEKETGRNGFLLNFSINELNGFKASVNGSGYFDWVVNSFLSLWTWVLGRVVRNLLENEVEQYILKRLPMYQFPVEGISCRKETKICDQQEGVENGQASVSESSMKQNQGRGPKRLRPSPLGKRLKCKSAKFGTAKDARSSLEVLKTFRDFLEPNECAAATNSSEVLEEKAEGKRDFCTENWLEMKELSRSLQEIQGEIDSIVDTIDKEFKEAISRERMQILEDNWSLLYKPEKVDVEYNCKLSTDCPASSVKEFENDESSTSCKIQEKPKESSMERYLKCFLSYRDKVKSLGKNSRKSRLFEGTCAKIEESLGKDVKREFDMETELSDYIDLYDSIPSSKLEPSIAEAFLNSTGNLDAKTKRKLDEKFDEILEGMKKKGKTDSSTNIDSLNFSSQMERYLKSFRTYLENYPQSKWEKTYTKTEESLCKNVDFKELDIKIELPENIANCDSILAAKLESHEIEGISNETFIAESEAFLDSIWRIDSETRTKLDKHFEKVFAGIKRNAKVESSMNLDSVDFDHCKDENFSSNMERYLKSFRSYQDNVKSLREDSRKSKLGRTCAEIEEILRKNVDKTVFDMKIKLPVNVDNCNSTKLGTYEIEENLDEAFLNSICNMDSKIRKKLDEQFDQILAGMKRDAKTSSSMNLISFQDHDYCENISSRNPVFMFRSTEKVQNESHRLYSKHFPGSCNVRECETPVKDSKPLSNCNCIEMPLRDEGAETRCISSPEDLVNGQIHLRSNTNSDITKRVLHDACDFVEVVATDSNNLLSNGFKNEVDEKATSSGDRIELELCDLPRNEKSSSKSGAFPSFSFPENGTCNGLSKYPEACKTGENFYIPRGFKGYLGH